MLPPLQATDLRSSVSIAARKLVYASHRRYNRHLNAKMYKDDFPSNSTLNKYRGASTSIRGGCEATEKIENVDHIMFPSPVSFSKKRKENFMTRRTRSVRRKRDDQGCRRPGAFIRKYGSETRGRRQGSPEIFPSKVNMGLLQRLHSTSDASWGRGRQLWISIRSEFGFQI